MDQIKIAGGQMHKAEDVLPYLPHLRRHARLLVGSQSLGDEFVRLCLEFVVAEPQRLHGDDLKVQLYRAFYAAWERVQDSLYESRVLGEVELKSRVEGGIGMLPEIERRALLLVVIEEFTYEQASVILEMTVDEVRQAVASARRDLLEKVSVLVLIIEDEPVVASDLARIVGEMGHRVAGMAQHQVQAVEQAGKLEFGLVLADLRLEDDSDGVAASRDILSNYYVPIVFVTGYPERLLTGGALEPAFVVAKPFSEEVLKMTIAQALAVYESPAEGSQHRDDLLFKLKQITGQGLARSA